MGHNKPPRQNEIPYDSVIVLSVGNYETHIWEDAAKKEEHKQQALAHAEKVVSKGTDKAAEVGLPNIDGKFVAGCPREVILHVAEENEVDVIAMGARGLGQLSRLILGSVSDFVMKNASCNVLIAKLSPQEKA